MSIYQHNFLVREIAYNGHLQSLGATAIAYITSALLHLQVSLSLLVAPYLLFQAVYFFDRYYDASRDEKTNPVRTGHIKKYYRAIPYLIALFLLTGLVLTLYTGTATATAFYVFAAVMGALYPIVFKPLTTRIPLFKNFYVGLVFSAMVIFPFLFTDTTLTGSLVPYLLLLFIFLETFISQIALDMKDEKADRAIKLMTLPALLGGDRAQNIVLVMSFTVAIAVTATALLLSAPYQVALLAVATLAFNVMMTRLVKNGKDIAFIAVAGKYLLWPALVLILP